MDEPKRDAQGRWLPGESGNLKGMPKGYRSMTADLHRILAEIPIGAELDAMFTALDIPPAIQSLIEAAGDRQEALMRAMVFRAMTGNWAAFGEIGERLDPKTRYNEIAGKDGAPIAAVGIQIASGTPADVAQADYLALVPGTEDVDGQDHSDDEHWEGSAF